MSTVSHLRYQCRTFESTYLFKFKSKDEVSLKIFDLSQKCIDKKIFSAKALALPVKELLAKGNFPTVLAKLAQTGLISKEHLVSDSKVTLETCEKVLDKTIDQFKPNVIVEKKEMEEFTCPLTLEIFHEPVIDNHGHTFEKSVIEDHLKKTKECPISRQPITSLSPNRVVQQTIEKWQQEDPIPSFSLFKKENPKLANTNLQMAQTYVEEKEYGEALDFYSKAFQYTRNCKDYTPIPSLFERMGDYKKATLAYLYLAKYQLKEGKIQEGIQTLEKSQQGKSFSIQNNLVLIELYYYSNQPKKALDLSIQTAATLSGEHREHAITLYKRILHDHPEQFSLYSSLAKLVDNPQEKGQILLKGALEALKQGDFAVAERLTLEGEKCVEDSFIDTLISLDFIRKQENTSRFKQKFLHLVVALEKKGLTKELLSTYKILFHLEKNPEYSQKIASAYQTLQKPQKEFQWSLTTLSLLIQNKKWEAAETLAKQTLQKTKETEAQTSLYENLEEIYTHWNGHQLEDLWPKLGKAYQESKKLELAEKTYRKAFKRFHRFEEALALAEVLSKSGKTQESVHTYYEAAAQALLEQNTQRLSLCTREIKQIDPHLQHLDLNQRMHLLTQEHILRLSEELSSAQEKAELEKKMREDLSQITQGHVLRLSEELSSAQEKIASLEQTVQPLKEKAILAEQKRKMREDLFGKAKWEKYFGDIGVEPPLPKDIMEVLKNPCPYWEGKKVEETHMLVLIPKTVDGKLLTLNTLQELIQNPKGGGHPTKYSTYYDVIQKECQPVSASYWALITKDVLPNSRNKTYAEQQTLIKGSYAVPGALEVTTAILMRHVQTGERIYTDNPWTYTRCQELLSNGYRVWVGGFGSSGLGLCRDFDSGRHDNVGLSGVRKF